MVEFLICYVNVYVNNYVNLQRQSSVASDAICRWRELVNAAMLGRVNRFSGSRLMQDAPQFVSLQFEHNPRK